MFFLHNLERRVTLHPSYFGRNMHELVTTKLVKDVEGTSTGDYFIIAIMDTFDISEGRILPGSGLAEFVVGYRAVIWRPFKEEVNMPDEIRYDGSASPPQFTNNADIVIENGTHTFACLQA
ncbi:DNA-directed RNA polymerase II subunit [Collariella sp. IMI 366227]|nr:DNA-directed RNA polymerase II subunit [Collariella sp. IMI 366227]